MNNILTLDTRDFSIYRVKDNQVLKIIPYNSLLALIIINFFASFSFTQQQILDEDFYEN
ncbi:MAG: hypothetical protein AB4062_14555 [Crocosphaera sp.]